MEWLRNQKKRKHGDSIRNSEIRLYEIHCSHVNFSNRITCTLEAFWVYKRTDKRPYIDHTLIISLKIVHRSTYPWKKEQRYRKRDRVILWQLLFQKDILWPKSQDIMQGRLNLNLIVTGYVQRHELAFKQNTRFLLKIFLQMNWKGYF